MQDAVPPGNKWLSGLSGIGIEYALGRAPISNSLALRSLHKAFCCDLETSEVFCCVSGHGGFQVCEVGWVRAPLGLRRGFGASAHLRWTSGVVVTLSVQRLLDTGERRVELSVLGVGAVFVWLLPWCRVPWVCALPACLLRGRGSKRRLPSTDQREQFILTHVKTGTLTWGGCSAQGAVPGA